MGASLLAPIPRWVWLLSAMHSKRNAATKSYSPFGTSWFLRIFPFAGYFQRMQGPFDLPDSRNLQDTIVLCIGLVGKGTGMNIDFWFMVFLHLHIASAPHCLQRIIDQRCTQMLFVIKLERIEMSHVSISKWLSHWSIDIGRLGGSTPAFPYFRMNIQLYHPCSHLFFKFCIDSTMVSTATSIHKTDAVLADGASLRCQRCQPASQLAGGFDNAHETKQ